MKRIGLLVGLGLSACAPAAEEKPAQLHEPQREISAEDLFAAWTGNSLAAERDFTDVPLRIKGNVAGVDEGVVVLLARGQTVSLNMLSGYDEALIALKPGAMFAADCEKSFYYRSGGAVLADDCRPATNKPVTKS